MFEDAPRLISINHPGMSSGPLFSLDQVVERHFGRAVTLQPVELLDKKRVGKTKGLKLDGVANLLVPHQWVAWPRTAVFPKI